MPIQIGDPGGHDFHQPLGLLSDCHRRIERFSHAMLKVSRGERGHSLSVEGRHALQLASVYFRTAAPLHTADEEHDLFPLLRRYAVDDDSGLAAKLDALESEHRDNEAVHDRVDVLVGRWLELERGGLPEEDADELIAKLEWLEGIYVGHIRIEEEEVFPAAGRLLAAHELEELGRAMAERRGLSFRGPLARFFCADHERLDTLLAASLTGEEGIRMEPFDQFRAGILRHISMEEKSLIPRATAALDGQRPPLADFLRVDHSAIATLLVPAPTREIVTELGLILDRHNRCEEEPGGLYELCDRAIGAEAAIRLVAELQEFREVALKPYNTTAQVARHLKESVARSWDAWREWDRGHGTEASGADC